MYIKSTNSLECNSRNLKYRYVLNRLKQIRKEYFHNKIISFKGVSKCLWTFLNGYIYRQNDKNTRVKCLNVNAVDVTEKKEIVDNLNLYFSIVGKELGKKFSINNNAYFLKYLTELNKEIIAFDLVHETQITKLIERFLDKKGSGLHNILNIMVRRLCYTIIILLTII